MPQRQGTRRVDASAVQGDGAYVIVRKMPYGLAKEGRRLLEASASADVQDEFTLRMFTDCVVEWNWVDDKGNPLPLPKDAGIAELTVEETSFLAGAIAGGPAPN